jgi:hypothetical protein
MNKGKLVFNTYSSLLVILVLFFSRNQIEEVVESSFTVFKASIIAFIVSFVVYIVMRKGRALKTVKINNLFIVLHIVAIFLPFFSFFFLNFYISEFLYGGLAILIIILSTGLLVREINLKKEYSISLFITTIIIALLNVYIAVGMFNEAYKDIKLSDKQEIVMNKGDKLIAETDMGNIEIIASGEAERRYIWDDHDCERIVILKPRNERWNGSFGIYSSGMGNHWKECNGISRLVGEEGQQHFNSQEDALRYIKKLEKLNEDLKEYRSGTIVYNNNGLVLSWGKVLGRRQLNVDFWQLYINGEKPKELPGADDGKIRFVE